MKQYRKTINVFWNLRFDFTALIKYIPEKYLRLLMILGSTDYGKYRIRVIPWKMFSVSIPAGKKRHTTTFYDIYQFYNMGLESASARYLGRHKIEMNPDLFRSPKYVDQHRDKIKEYGILDAVLAKDLGVNMQDAVLEELGVSFNRPVSPAYLSGQYFAQTSYIPQVHGIPRGALEYYYKSYHGGRFEVGRRGRFEDAYLYDLTSAYPFEMSSLIDPTKGRWVKSRDILWDAHLGAVHCHVNIDDHYYGPLAYTFEPQLFPWGKWKGYFTLNELRFIRDNNLGRVLHGPGWYFYPSKIYHPFSKMRTLFELREEYKKAGDPHELVLKICMSSLYGKTWQLTDMYRKTRDGEEWDYRYREDGEEWINYTLKHETGRFWNPVFASEITSMVRLRLMKMCLGYPVLGMSTDSVFSEDRIPNKVLREFGSWEERSHGDLLLLGSGRYTMKSEDEDLTKNRGFESKLDLIELLEENPRKKLIKIPALRPVSLHEALTRKSTPDMNFYEMMNAFVPRELELDINFDQKRIWDRDFKNARDALKHNIDSLAPLVEA